ncbi:hypothetical protein PGT21_011993 [Puccinia graminis f. sp. tritici]|uniref:Uncharacterized protein n=1 Tax=Puccinia graminis f. sp. tritici TaxID=56615 RepID=A0A5B0LL99_PUCGR|nr:hypothetical protein PGT21_011993 [Puccinia graminis f. sp. tritici]
MYTSSPGGIPPGGMASLGTGYPLGYPDIRQVWAEKRPSAAESAPAGGYPLALAGIRQGIADIRGGLSPPISTARQSAAGVQIGVREGGWLALINPRIEVSIQVQYSSS